MPAKLRPRKFEINEKCIRSCTLNVHNLPGSAGDLIHAWYEAGDNNETIVQRAESIGARISESAVARHRRNHLVPADHFTDVEEDDGRKVSELELLDIIIQRGAKDIRLKTAKITGEQALRAIELKFKLTQGSVLEDTFAALGLAMEEAVAGENPEATATPDERVEPSDEALEAE